MRINASNSSFSMAKIYEKNNRIDKKVTHHLVWLKYMKKIIGLIKRKK